MGNQEPLIEEKTIQISTEYWGLIMMPRKISSVCSPCGTLRTTLATNPVISNA